MIQPFRPIPLVLKNLASHRRSNLLSRSIGISMTSTPGSWPSPGLQGLNARGALKVPRRMLAAPRRGCTAPGGAGERKQPHRRLALSYARENLSSTMPGIRSKISTGHYCPDGHHLALAFYPKKKNSMLPAWAAGLLADNERLRQSKPFRAARKKLNVRATREGFGPGARDFLSLPDTMGAQNPHERLSEKGAHDH